MRYGASAEASFDTGQAQMEFYDFELRAWRANKTHIQVIVHSSPAGDLGQPIKTLFDEQPIDPRLIRNGYYWPRGRLLNAITIGRKLSIALLPPPVFALLLRSLNLIGPGAGLRLRLCLDEALINFPWEYLYRPDIVKPDVVNGFLALDSRISIVRGAPTTTETIEASDRSQRLVFSGTIQGGEQDYQQVRKEFQEISGSLASIPQLLSTQFVAGAANQIERALDQPTAIFHFSGLTYIENGKGFLIRTIEPPPLPDCPRLHSDIMSCLLKNAGTRLAFFNAVNSYQWDFIEPFVRANIPALIGVYDATSIPGGILFAQKLYASLAKGLSIDEAVTWARLDLFQTSSENSCEWGQFVVYMPTSTPVLLARPQRQEVTRYQTEARDQRQQTVDSARDKMGGEPRGKPPTNKTALRQAIMKAFDVDDLKLLCTDVTQDLANVGIQLQVDLETIGGNGGREIKIQELIDYLDRRSYLDYLTDAIHRVRPALEW